MKSDDKVIHKQSTACPVYATSLSVYEKIFQTSDKKTKNQNNPQICGWLIIDNK